MAAPMEKTRTPGIFKRGGRYVVTFRDATGRQRKESAPTYDAARTLKRKRDQQSRDGETHTPKREQLTLAAYACELYGADLEREEGGEPEKGRYQGRRGAVRDSTRADYRRDIEAYWLPALGRRRLPTIMAPDIAKVLAEIAGREEDGYLTDRSLKRLYAPLSALLAQAVEEGLITHNPARDVTVPTGRDALRRFDQDDDADEDDPQPGKAKALTESEIAGFLLVVDVRWQILFELLACTGLRISEALALRWRDLQLDGSAPAVKVRRGLVKGVYGPPKSKHGRRDVPMPFGLVTAFRNRRTSAEWHGDDDLVFPSLSGTAMQQSNLRSRVLVPAAEEAGVSWAGFHAFRHHCASRLIASGRNIVQVSRWLGHHSPGFTLVTYAHLMDDGVGAPLELKRELDRPAGATSDRTRDSLDRLKLGTGGVQ
jgi:integrase